jgi:amidase
MTGIDPKDDATKKSEGKFSGDYVKGLNANALKGARIGIARDFMGADQDVDWVIESAIDAMKAAGATVVTVHYPKWLLDAKGEFYNAVRYPEFVVEIGQYLSTLDPKYPKSLKEMIDRAEKFNGTRPDGARPNPSRWVLFKRELDSGTLDDYRYKSVHDFGLPLMRNAVEGIIAENKLDAIVYPTSSRKPGLISGPLDPPGGPRESATNIANLTGFPDLIVPAGFTGDRLPVGISFFGPAFSEQKLLALGYSFEQTTKARRRPIHAPALEGGTIQVP